MRKDNGDSRLRKPQGILFLGLLVAILAWALWCFSRDQDISSMDLDNSLSATTRREIHRTSTATPSSHVSGLQIGHDVASSIDEVREIQVHVLRVDGTPLAGQFVLLVEDEGGRRRQGVTDSDGEVCFPHPGSGHLVARFLGSAPVIRNVTPERDIYTLRRKGGLRIDGKLVIEGRPPGMSLTFSASVYQSGLTDRFYHALGREAHNCDIEPIPVRCNPDGEFRITGLQAGWKIRINLPDGLRMMEGDPDQGRRVRYIEMLRDNMHLDLLTERETHVRGRCIDRDGTPLRGVPVQVKVAWKSRRHGNPAPTDYLLLETDEQGRFATWLNPNAFSRVQFVAWWGGLEISQEVDTSERNERSLPDFVFPQVRNLRLHVVDEYGDPIRGAKVGPPDGRVILTTDDSGNLALPLIPTQPLNLHVAAPGFAFETVVIPQSSTPDVNVKLQRATHVIVALRDSRGRPMASRRINLRFTGTPLNRQDAFDSPIYRSAHPRVRFSRRDGVCGMLGKTNAQGEINIDDLAAGQEVVARVFGRGGPLVRVVYEVKGLPEERIELVVPPNAAASVFGQVLDTSGTPVPDALILIGESKHGLVQAGFSDERGRFIIDDVVFKPVHVRIGKVGYRSATRFIAAPRKSSRPLRFVLPRSTQCRLLVEDASGNPLREAHVEVPRVYFAGMGPVCLKRGDGVFDIVDLGDDPCPAFVYGPGGARHKITIRPDVDTLKIVRWD